MEEVISTYRVLMKNVILILLLLVSLNALSQNSSENTKSTAENLELTKNEVPDSLKLFAFVGEKIYFKPRARFPKWAFYGKYIAKYKVLKCIYGNCEEETIKFKAYSHIDLRSYPEYALLIVNKNKRHYELEYRQMFSVQKTIDGRWANCGHWNRGEGSDGKLIEPVPLKFEESIWEDLSGLKKERIPQYYPEPYYEIINDSARCLMGYYAEDLFIIQKYGVLKARGIFN